MKKLLFVLPLLFFAGTASAAMTCVETSFVELPYSSSTKETKFALHLTCTCDTTPGTAVATLSTSTMTKISGKYGYTIITEPGDTAPTDDSDLAIADSRGLALLTAAGNGLNLVDATTVKQEYFEGPNTDHYPLFNSAYPLTITLTNNAVNNSIINLYIDMTE